MKKPSSSVSNGSDPHSSADVLPAGSPEVSAKSGPVVSGAPAPAPPERCAKCGCPQSKHHPVEPRRTLKDRPDVESYCEACGAEDCWHFTKYTPAPLADGDTWCAECGETVPAGDAHQHTDAERAPLADGGEDILENLKGYDEDRVCADPTLIASDIQKAIREIAALRAEVERLRAENAVLRSCADERNAGDGPCGICAECLRADVERLDFQRNHLDTMVTALTGDLQSAEARADSLADSMIYEKRRAEKAERENEKLSEDFRDAHRAVTEWMEKNEKLAAALREIEAIKNKLDGPDWDEIEEARRIAARALADGERK